MKLAVTSDLHLPITSAQTIAELGEVMGRFEPDALVVAGDLAETLADLDRCMSILRSSVDCPVWVLVGNHDVWVRDEANSHRLWQEVLPERVQRAGYYWLEGRSFAVGDVAVSGTIAWYDYSAADPGIQATAQTFADNKRYFNNDALLIDWEWSDPQFAALVAKPFLTELDRLEADDAVRRTVVITHVPVFECQMYRRPDNRDWAFSNAYFGNLTLGGEIVQRRKVGYVISGHTHVERHGCVQRPDGGTIEAWLLGSEYRRPTWLGLSIPAHPADDAPAPP
jgi:3',5'-cyclic AMP phosphodiesterase CpdA